MPHPSRTRSQTPYLDIVSHGRHGPSERLVLSAADRELVLLTVRRAPEVMVKISGGGHSASKVAAHLRYIGRRGDLPLELDDGEQVQGTGSWHQIVNDWDLDLEGTRPAPGQQPSAHPKPAKLVHNIIFSMPPGTSPEKLWRAVRAFAREQFGLQHRYAMALHTDEPHPHVHVVVKAMSERGKRLNPSPATLRAWRSEFARQLREQGVEANATRRVVRGVTKSKRLDGIYRAALRNESRHVRERTEALEAEMRNGAKIAESAKGQLLATRKYIVLGWRAIAELMRSTGEHGNAEQIEAFVRRMPDPRTDKEWLRAGLLSVSRNRQTSADVIHKLGPVKGGLERSR